ncbi:hypothetical protein D3C81_1008170 [compost metagenome]
MGHCSPCAASAHLHYLTARRIGQATAKAFGKAQAVSVVADALAVLEHHGVDRADALGLRRQLVEQRQDRLFAWESDVQAGEAHVLSCCQQLFEGAAVEFELVQVDQPVQVIQALRGAFALVQRRGARGLDAGADKAGENAGGGGQTHAENSIVVLGDGMGVIQLENVPNG